MAGKKKSDQSTDLADKLFPEFETEVEVLNIPPEQRRLHTETLDYSVSTLIDYLDKGHIFVPEFQRGYVWTPQQASRLIESLIIQCPIPVIYLSQDKSERLAVIDGNQRINSISNFLKNKLSLKGLTAYPEIEGLTFSELDPRIQRHISNRTLRCIVILKETHPQVQFDVFERLNTGSKSLNPQELRNGLYYGDLMVLLSELSTNEITLEFFPEGNKKRMKNEELILRFLAITNRFKHYYQPVSAFLNDFCKDHINIDENKVGLYKKEYLECMKLTKLIFGKQLMFSPPSSSDLKKSFYVALFDAQMVAVSKMNEKQKNLAISRKVEIQKAYKSLFDNKDFIKSITKATPNKANLVFRIKKIQEILG